jgi:threonine/homoserine/homoserine lactone efflux protein
MEHLWLYAVLVAGIIMLPGMDMAFVLASTLVDGRRSGAAAVAGIVLGGMVHVAMGALGVGLLLQLFPLAFNGLLLAGSLYVAWMGYGLLRNTQALSAVQDQPSRPLHSTFMRATLTCLMNPKAYIFMLAVFPQFIRPQLGNIVGQSIALGAITAATQIAVYGGVALAAAQLHVWLSGSSKSQTTFSHWLGGLLVLTAVWTLWMGWRAA